MFSRAPSSRSTRVTMPTTSRPSSRARSTAFIEEPPVVVTSSTITTREPAGRFLRPSSHWPVPCPFGSLRMMKAATLSPFETGGNRGGGGDRIGAQGQPANAMDRAGKLLDFLPESLADQQPAPGVQSRLFAIEIEIALAPGSQGHFALFVGELTDNLHQLFSLPGVITNPPDQNVGSGFRCIQKNHGQA